MRININKFVHFAIYDTHLSVAEKICDRCTCSSGRSRRMASSSTWPMGPGFLETILVDMLQYAHIRRLYSLGGLTFLHNFCLVCSYYSTQTLSRAHWWPKKYGKIQGVSSVWMIEQFWFPVLKSRPKLVFLLTQKKEYWYKIRPHLQINYKLPLAFYLIKIP